MMGRSIGAKVRTTEVAKVTESKVKQVKAVTEQKVQTGHQFAFKLGHPVQTMMR